ncbi:MAG TPA: polyprenyl synthetase family protein [Bryobacteraceae bacterium]|jgi:octaprenyl-diphosphate synthase|nr:polyprenyl synthetase family protein [Bryobacteraceae bacterium]
MPTEGTKHALSAHDIFDLVRSDLELVEKAINVESLASVETVTTIGRYLQQSGGKRLRPALLLLCSRFAGGDGTSAVQLGAVVEMIHSATLVHDDVIDVAQTRRGRTSANVQWGNHTCVLAGDWLYMQAFQVALRERNFHVLDLLISLTQMMVEGELIQLDRIGRIGISEADCMELVDRKTACLFSACAKLGAVSAGASTETEEKLGEFAWNLGMAFQLIDDMLDFTSREQTLGKPVGGDLKEGKVTLPLVYALETASAAEKRLVETVLRDRSYDAAPFAEIFSMIERHGGIQRTRERAQHFTDRARQLVAEFPESPYQRALCTLTDLITERDR